MDIRLARLSDAVAVNELLAELGYPQSDPAATAARIQTWTDDPAGAVYVADTDHGVLGVIAVHTCPFFEREGTWARIVALVVSAQARRQGIGSRLIAAAESFATHHGCLRIEVTSSPHRTQAHTFYQSHNYTVTPTRFLQNLTTH
ncbi:N-acetylglutamate synthase-like GNAT family acetyltransferase [Kribbella sp. VKM Ac-2571]|uniref:GNAT family N-acetyltransferase n=1 Tax=Kribbella sp. VKM Ac-2571 TaxID=2512222 RepID=UPI00105B61E2|nr:GNAT family N-acetyltransferase [Kribbella sp. VKM Ac-2571]TDO69198.1 N-acetylglutamate synthase-like GNAT family acetyltransferase [Kribbella sp. VKM Ac-2571]